MQPDIIIETPRLHLYGVSPQFIKRIFLENTKDEIKHFFGCSETGYQRLEQMNHQGLESFRISIYSFVLTLKSELRAIGECGFHTWNSAHQRAEIFYHIHLDSDKGQGFMKEALPAVLEYGFEQMQLHRITGLVAAENAPSLKLLHHHGFTFEGIMREDYLVEGQHESSHCYSLLKHEWKKE